MIDTIEKQKIEKQSLESEKLEIFTEVIRSNIKERQNKNKAFFLDNSKEITILEQYNNNDSNMDPLHTGVTPPELEPQVEEELALIELIEILKESNLKIEAHQQKYKLNIELIILSEEYKESPVVHALKQEIARKIGNLLEMMPTFLRKFIIGERYAKSSYRKNNITFSNTNLILPEPDSQKYVRWADRNKPERWPDKRKYDQWVKLVDSRSGTAINFFNLNWHDYVEAELLYQTDLRGGRSMDNPKKGLDETLFNLLKKECKEQKISLASILPNNIKKSTNRLKNSIKYQMVA